MASATIKVRVRKTVTVRVTVETVFKVTARISHSCDRKPGIRRERIRGGFRYRSPKGNLVRDRATLDRIKAIVIPPAWENVWICASARGHIQATGFDARGRKQYRYHPAFRFSKENEKFTHLASFGTALGRIRRSVEQDLTLPGLPREKVLAAVVRLLDRTHLRVGNVRYREENHSFGLSTLLDRHVSFEGGAMRLRFRGKSGVWHEREVDDPVLVRVVRSCQHLPGQDLFQYRDESGERHRIGSCDVNDYIRTAANGDFSAKDFRTWAGTVAALARLAVQTPPTSKTAAERVIVDVVKEVAAELGNTRAVCRKSYIHPQVLKAFADNSLPRQARRHPGLSANEGRVLELLSRQREVHERPGRIGLGEPPSVLNDRTCFRRCPG
jgi:DNA topoisomerase-1